MTTSAASGRVLCVTGHVVNSRREMLKSSSVNDMLFFNSALKLGTKRSRLQKGFTFFT